MNKKQQEYLKCCGNKCPHCGSRDITAEYEFDVDGSSGWRNVQCNGCRWVWVDYYELKGFDNLQGPDGEEE